MLVTIQCPECRNSARVEDQFLGRTVRCRNCETPFVAKAAAAPTPAKKPAPSRSPSDAPVARTRPTRPADDEDEPRPTRARAVRRDDFEEDDEEVEERPRRRKKKKPAAGNGLYIGIGLAVGLVGMGIVLALTLGGSSKPAEPAVVQANRDPVATVPAVPRTPTAKANPEAKVALPVVAAAPGDNKTEPAIAEADRKLFTVWNVRVRPQGGDLALSFDFRRKNQIDHPPLMLILLTETGEKIVIDLNRGGAKNLDDATGSVTEVIGSGGGEGPGGGMGKMGPRGPGGPPGRGNRALPKFAKGSKFWIAGHGAREPGSGPFGSPGPGLPLSNVIEMVFE